MNYDYDIFISYRKQEPPKDWVFKYFLSNFEKELKFQIPRAKIYIDEQQIRGGMEWEPSLIEALGRSQMIVPIFLPSYFASDCWAIKEMAYMYNRHKIYCDNPIVSPIMPIVLGGHFSQDYQCTVQSYDFTETRKLGMCSSKALLSKLINKIEHLVKDIRQNRTQLPEWNENFVNPVFFSESMEYVNDVRKFYKLSDEFDTFSNPKQF